MSNSSVSSASTGNSTEVLFCSAVELYLPQQPLNIMKENRARNRAPPTEMPTIAPVDKLVLPPELLLSSGTGWIGELTFLEKIDIVGYK